MDKLFFSQTFPTASEGDLHDKDNGDALLLESGKDILILKKNYSNNKQINTTGDGSSLCFLFAMQHTHNNPLNVSICLKETAADQTPLVLHTFIADPHKPQWLLNGMPLLLHKTPWSTLFIQYTDALTHEPIHTHIQLYGGALPYEVRSSLIRTQHIFPTHNDKYILFHNGLASLKNKEEIAPFIHEAHMWRPLPA